MNSLLILIAASAPLLSSQPTPEEVQKLINTPPAQVRAYPTADQFPGAVPREAPRVTQSLPVDTKIPGWHSTGLYAAPGELISIEIPASAAGKKLRVRIGAHRDNLSKLEKLKRFPIVTREFPLAAARTEAANAFGGAVYVEVPDKCALGTITVTIRGAVQAPWYVHGRTSLADWKNKLRNLPAPWAEIGSDRIILSVPSSAIRALDDPSALMELWNRVVDAEDDLAAWPRPRTRPERIVPDVQISAGYMHAGCPVMVQSDMNNVLADRDRLSKGQWGFFHELGHNHQSRDWTFDGTGEVTCNLFSLYVFETVCGIRDGGHPAMKADKREKRMQEYFASGADFEKWKKDPFLALTMYWQMKEAFGWEPFKKAFAAYRALPDAERPKTDDAKRDQWLVRFSRQVGRNLGPFFTAWGVPTSAEARDSIRNLPAWMPANFPPR